MGTAAATAASTALSSSKSKAVGTKGAIRPPTRRFRAPRVNAATSPAGLHSATPPMRLTLAGSEDAASTIQRIRSDLVLEKRFAERKLLLHGYADDGGGPGGL
ncbi:hypothetical protein GCM10017744_038640 [Streptomyces antimycoticus]